MRRTEPMTQRALITLGEGYGNIVMATPTVAAVRSLGYRVDALVESRHPDAATLLAGWDAVDTIHLTRGSLRAATAHNPYDAVVRTLWNRSGPLDLGPEVHVERLSLRRNHEAEVNLTAARALGFAGPLPSPCVQTQLPFWPLPERFIAVAPGYSGSNRRDWSRKAWPRWSEFCDRFHESFGLDVLVLGAEADQEEWMTSESRPWLHNLCGRTSIRGAAGIVGRSERLVAIDNGLAHVGAAAGASVTVLFGATSEVKNRPLGENVRVVAAAMTCRPCQMTARWKRCADRRCMSEIGVRRVLNAVKRGLETSCPRARAS